MDSCAESKKTAIEYPCPWLFKVIATDRETVEARLPAIFAGVACAVRMSNVSSGGRYVSLDVEMDVESEAHRDQIYGLLKAIDSVRMVL